MKEEKLIDPRNPAPAEGQRRPPLLGALTSVRFAAALYVALYHLVRPFSLWGPFAGFMAAGYTGVSFFFLLSGYILTYSHGREASTNKLVIKRFYFARFARIYPVYLLLLIFAGYVYRNEFAHRVHILAFVADLAMVQTWSLRTVAFFNIPAWSVSSEMFFYAVFPFLLLALRPRSQMQGIVRVVWLWLLAMALPVLCLIFFPAGAWHEGNGIVAFWVRRFPPAALPEFLAGIPLAWIFLRFRPNPRNSFVMMVIALLGLVAALLFADYLPALMLHNGLLIPLFAAILVGLSERNLLSRLLSHPILIVLGEASYALYLLHFAYSDWANRMFGMNDGLRDGFLKLLVVVPLSVGLHFVVERPCRRALLRWWNRGHRRAPDAETPVAAEGRS